MSPTASSERPVVLETVSSGDAAPVGTARSGGDDRPTEEIGFNFTKPQEPQPTLDTVEVAGTGPGSPGGDDRPTEEIGFSFTKPPEPTPTGPTPTVEAGAPMSSGGESDELLDFSGLSDDNLPPDDVAVTLGAGDGDPGIGESPASAYGAEDGGTALQGDPTGDGIADLVTAPRLSADDFIA